MSVELDRSACPFRDREHNDVSTWHPYLLSRFKESSYQAYCSGRLGIWAHGMRPFRLSHRRLCPCGAPRAASIIGRPLVGRSHEMNMDELKAKSKPRFATQSLSLSRNLWGGDPRCACLRRTGPRRCPAQRCAHAPERQLAKTVDGVDMVKRLRQNLMAQGRETLRASERDHRRQDPRALYRH